MIMVVAGTPAVHKRTGVPSYLGEIRHKTTWRGLKTAVTRRAFAEQVGWGVHVATAIHVASTCSQLDVVNRTNAAIIGSTLPNLLDQAHDHQSSQR